MGTIIRFPKLKRTIEPKFGDIPARTNRRLHISAEEGRRRLLAGTLPPWSVILGDLRFTDLDSPLFPPNVHVCGSLNLHDCIGVTKLAAGLEVDGIADFSGSALTKLPRKSRINGLTYLLNMRIKGVPRDFVPQGGLVVDESASASLRALAVKWPVKWMAPVIKF